MSNNRSSSSSNDWENRKYELIRSLFEDPTPIEEPREIESMESDDNSSSTGPPDSPLPPLHIEVVPAANRDDDESDEFYEELMKKLRILCRKLFIENVDISRSELNTLYKLECLEGGTHSDKSDYDTKQSRHDIADEEIVDNRRAEQTNDKEETIKEVTTVDEESVAPMYVIPDEEADDKDIDYDESAGSDNEAYDDESIANNDVTISIEEAVANGKAIANEEAVTDEEAMVDEESLTDEEDIPDEEAVAEDEADKEVPAHNTDEAEQSSSTSLSVSCRLVTTQAEVHRTDISTEYDRFSEEDQDMEEWAVHNPNEAEQSSSTLSESSRLVTTQAEVHRPDISVDYNQSLDDQNMEESAEESNPSLEIEAMRTPRQYQQRDSFLVPPKCISVGDRRRELYVATTPEIGHKSDANTRMSPLLQRKSLRKRKATSSNEVPETNRTKSISNTHMSPCAQKESAKRRKTETKRTVDIEYILDNWDKLKSNFFVGKPIIHRGCTCFKHMCQ